MSLKFKAFVYRFSNIFGLRIYLASKEEKRHIDSLWMFSEFDRNLGVGLWQARHGFTTVWTGKQPMHKAFISKVKHAFDFRGYDND